MAATAHEFHVSKCQIEYNQEEKAIQVTLHIFLNDLEEALRQKGADKLFICTEKENDKAEAYLVDYLRERFHLEVNKQPAAFIFIGKEPSEDLQATWCYLEFTGIEQLKNLKIENNLLLEAFEDQKNIVSVMASGKQLGYFLFQSGHRTESMSFN